MHLIEYQQTVPASLSSCWEFFSSPSNLALLTPAHLGFTQKSADKAMYEGQIIIHRLTPLLGLPISWVTEITHMKPLDYFVDEQRFGPYKFWHHEHRFQEVPKGTEIVDKIHYLLPFGILGAAINYFKVRQDLDKIFTYRREKIAEIFAEK